MITRRQTLCATALASLLLAPSVFAPGVSQAAEPIVVGMFGPMSGEKSAFGTRFREAIEMFVEDVNDQGGIEGRPLEVIYEDSRGNPREAANIAQKFAQNDSMLAVVGGWSSTESMAAAPILTEAGLAQVSPTASHPDFTQISEYQFRMVNTQKSLSFIHRDLLMDKLGLKRIAILYYQDDWGAYVNSSTAERVVEAGGEVVLQEAMIPDTRDFRALVTKVKATAPDGVFLASHYAESSTFIRQLRQAGIEVPVLGADTLQNPKFLELAGEAAEGVVMPSYYFSEDPDALDFTQAYEARWERLPDYYAVFGYDAIGIVTQSIGNIIRAGGDLTRGAVRDQIAATKDYPGVGGVNTFDEVGDVVKPMRVLQIREGDYRLYN